MTDEQIEKCRVSLWITMVTAFATEDIERLVEFERLDAVAGSPPHCEECGCSASVRKAKAALALLVVAVLKGESE